MSPLPTSQEPLAPELQTVADAASAAVDAEAAVEHDSDVIAERQAAVRAAIVDAVQAGHPLEQITDAKAIGEAGARDRLRGEMLKQIERTRRKMKAATTEHEDSIRRGARAKLSAREMAAAADVAPGTIRTLLERSAAAAGGDSPPPPAEVPGEDAPASTDALALDAEQPSDYAHGHAG